MRSAKVRLTASIASFRYPHFLVGRQASYEMPPPSTIYGHLASAVGVRLDPKPVRFAYAVSYAARGMDLEHQHIISRYPPEKMSRGESAKFRAWRQANEFSVGGSVQPTVRDFLFNLDLTLYLVPHDLGGAFRRPVFPVVLGRSQDLACVVSVEEVELESASSAYFSGTLLPFSWRARTGFGTTVLMPRFITPPPEREASFSQYIILPADKVVFAGRARSTVGKPLLQTDPSEAWLVDPATAEREGCKRGVVWHSFVDA
ncbi:MAG: CRISPR-associated protein Cas5 [Gammaproteobacteria bacterium]